MMRLGDAERCRLESAQARRRDAVERFVSPCARDAWVRATEENIAALVRETESLESAARELERALAREERRYDLAEDSALARPISFNAYVVVMLLFPFLMYGCVLMYLQMGGQVGAWSFVLLASAEAWAWTRRKVRVQALRAQESAAESALTA